MVEAFVKKSKCHNSWGARHFGGYAGVKHTAKHIVAQVPNMSKYNTWVEPFSGLGRTAEHVSGLNLILNDKSEYANNYCKEHFPNAIVENMDFMETINKYDSPTTFFLIDPPWRYHAYSLNNLAFCDRKVVVYYRELLERIKTLQGDWFLLSDAAERENYHTLTKSGWGTRVVMSEKKVLFGLYAKTLICSNLFI